MHIDFEITIQLLLVYLLQFDYISSVDNLGVGGVSSAVQYRVSL